MSRILVSVGTDHHPFQRLVDWADAFAERHPDDEVFVQYGSARPPAHAESSALLDHAELQDQIARADVVVCHGGPATITDVRRSGLIPICVPRDPSRGEHVDGHQMRFAARIAQGGLIDCRTDVDELADAVVTALSRGRVDPDSLERVPDGVRAVGLQISALLGRSGQSL